LKEEEPNSISDIDSESKFPVWQEITLGYF
jgi:hypothetical protein